MRMSKLWYSVKVYLFRNIRNYKFLAILLFYAVFIYSIVAPFRMISKEIGYDINFGLFALFLTDVRVKLVFFVGIAILFSNLPFKDSLQILLIQRLGKRMWYLTQIIYVFISSVIINVCFIIIFYLMLFPLANFDNGWGTLLRSMARQEIQLEEFINGGTIAISELVISNYSPDKAVLLTMSISILVTVIVGLIILLGNRIVNNGGIVITYTLIFINLFVPRALGRYIFFFSPITWISLSHTATSQQSYLPNHTYVYSTSILTIIGIIMWILLTTTNHTEIEIGR